MFFVASSNQLGGDRKYTLRGADFHDEEFPVDIGVKWRDFARALGVKEASIVMIANEIHCAKECCIKVLVFWLRQEGKDATAEKLFEALVKIRLTNLVPCKPSDPSQVILTHTIYMHILYYVFDSGGKTSSLAIQGLRI